MNLDWSNRSQLALPDCKDIFHIIMTFIHRKSKNLLQYPNHIPVYLKAILKRKLNQASSFSKFRWNWSFYSVFLSSTFQRKFQIFKYFMLQFVVRIFIQVWIIALPLKDMISAEWWMIEGTKTSSERHLRDWCSLMNVFPSGEVSFENVREKFRTFLNFSKFPSRETYWKWVHFLK